MSFNNKKKTKFFSKCYFSFFAIEVNSHPTLLNWTRGKNIRNLMKAPKSTSATSSVIFWNQRLSLRTANISKFSANILYFQNSFHQQMHPFIKHIKC